MAEASLALAQGNLEEQRAQFASGSNYARRSMASYCVAICDPTKSSASNRRPRSLKWVMPRGILDICLNYRSPIWLR